MRIYGYVLGMVCYGQAVRFLFWKVSLTVTTTLSLQIQNVWLKLRKFTWSFHLFIIYVLFWVLYKPSSFFQPFSFCHDMHLEVLREREREREKLRGVVGLWLWKKLQYTTWEILYYLMHLENGWSPTNKQNPVLINSLEPKLPI